MYMSGTLFPFVVLFGVTANREDKTSAMTHPLGQEQLEEVVGMGGFGIPQPVSLDKESGEAARLHIAQQCSLRPTEGWTGILLHGCPHACARTHAHTHTCSSKVCDIE